MAASTVYLQAFQEVVSIGHDTDTVEVIAQKFCTTLSHRLLLLNRQQQTIGFVYLPKLLTYLLSNQSQQVPINQVRPNLIDPLPLETAPPPPVNPTIAAELVARNADLTQLNRLKDEFLACVTHELRSPLTAILGLSTLLKDQSIGPLNERQLRYAHLIYNSGRNLISLVNDMLDLTRIETNQLELHLSPVDIAQVCLGAFEQARQLRDLEGHHHSNHTSASRAAAADATSAPKFDLDIAPGLVRLVADENRLRQMLVNLLSNALKFTEDGGSIGLKVNRWEGWIAFTVWDTGIGIPPEKHHLIFQKFQQLESPMTRQFEGTGLGLVLTRRLAHLHGGDITFTSEEHHGSQFTLLLPPEPPQSVAQTETHDSPPASLRSESLATATPARLALVVEASPHNLNDLSMHLTELGYRIAVARSGPDALEKARQLQPRVILLNPVLPVLSGWDVLTLLKARDDTRNIPVVITASKLEPDHPQRSQADACLGLPILHQSLESTLAKLHALNRSEPPARSHVVIVYLNPVEAEITNTRTLQVNHLLHEYNFRVLESDNLEQAELLAKVWKAQVVVLNQTPADPASYLSQFVQCPYLASLPLITLDTATTQAANQMPDLAVFPCLMELPNRQTPAAVGLTAEIFTENLLKAVEVAIGFTGRPLILATDIEQWQTSPTPDHRHDWLNAIAQYIQAAGLRCSIGQSLSNILNTLQTHSIDLLLLHWDQKNLLPLRQTIKRLKSLQKNSQIAPVKILICSGESPCQFKPAMQRDLHELNIQLVHSNQSMDELLHQIRHELGIAK